MFSQRAYKENQIVGFLVAVFAWLCVFLVFGGCTPTSQATNQLSTNTNSGQEEHLAVTTPNPESLLKISTPMPTEIVDAPSTPLITETVIIPFPTPQLAVETETITVTMTPTSEPELENITGHLFVYNSVGIQQIALADGSSQAHLTTEAEWLDWGASFSQNKKYLVYWIKTDQGTELWFTSLPKWQPRRILQIENVAYDFAIPLWGVNDRYLLFNLSVLDNSYSLEDIKTIGTYIIDMETMELVNQSYWPGDCSILATSPQTSELALWCSKLEEDESLPELLVLEPNESPWLTKETPDSLIDDCLILFICAWSQDGEFIAYVNHEDYPGSLFYTVMDNPSPVRLDDTLTKHFSFPSWSPDSQFLYYSGACADGTFECPNIMSMVNQEVVWRPRDNDNRGELGDFSEDRIIWSPDSRYLAIPILVLTKTGAEEQVLFFDFITQQEVLRISEINDAILDMVWVSD